MSSDCANAKRCLCKTRLDGRIALITGANTGIGYQTAKDLLSRGAHVILGCRSAERAEAAVNNLIKETGCNSVEYQLIDLANLQSVRDFADVFTTKYPKLDLLVNNAGVYTNSVLTKDGFEIHLQVNHLGHFLLTNLLLENLKRADQGRIITVSSALWKYGNVPWDGFKKTIYPALFAYANSKLCNILFTRELRKRLSGSNVTANTLHPGFILTDILREAPFILTVGKFLTTFLPFMTKSLEGGAQTTIHLCVCPELSSVSGEYFSFNKFSDCAKSQTGPKAENDEDAARLWKVSEEFCSM